MGVFRLFVIASLVLILGLSGYYYLPKQTGSPTPSSSPASTSLTLYLVALEGTHEETDTIGCGDVLVPMTRPSDGSPTVEEALTELFATSAQTVSDDNVELYNSLAQSTLSVEKVEVTNGTATVSLKGQLVLGGVCDEPRVEEQITATVKAATSANTVTILVNGQNLKDL